MCERVGFGDGSFAIICGGRRSHKKCSVCRRAPGVRLCDGEVVRGKTCDKPLCEACATRIAPDRDLCPMHAGKVAMELPATRSALKQAGWEQLETRKCRKCDVEIEFWRAPSKERGKPGQLHPLEVRPDKHWTLDTHFRFCPYAKEFSKGTSSSSPQKPTGQKELFK